MLRIILLVALILMLLGSLPVWSYNTGWGYYPVGGLSLAIVIILLILFRGRSRV